MAHPEHSLQVQVKKFVSDCVTCEHKFLSFDRSQNHSGRQHLWESARGVAKGTPDTLILCPGLPGIFCELKAPGRKPDEAQEMMGDHILRAGHEWFWASSVVAYRDGLLQRGVPLSNNSYLVAEHRDALLESARIKAVEAPKKSSRPFAAKPSSAQIRKVGAIRARTMF